MGCDTETEEGNKFYMRAFIVVRTNDYCVCEMFSGCSNAQGGGVI